MDMILAIHVHCNFPAGMPQRYGDRLDQMTYRGQDAVQIRTWVESSLWQALKVRSHEALVHGRGIAERPLLSMHLLV